MADDASAASCSLDAWALAVLAVGTFVAEVLVSCVDTFQ